jgi:hypothetical protein
MSIEPARLVIGSAKRDGVGGRKVLPPACVTIFPVNPATVSSYAIPGGAVESTTPSCVGQIAAHQNPSYPNQVELFIADTLSTWKKVNFASLLIDVNTGKPYDPNAGFYNPLAS